MSDPHCRQDVFLFVCQTALGYRAVALTSMNLMSFAKVSLAKGENLSSTCAIHLVCISHV